MSMPSVLEMIEAVIAQFGENEGFKLMDIDKTTYYNYKKGGNPNRKKLERIKQIFNSLSNPNDRPVEMFATRQHGTGVPGIAVVGEPENVYNSLTAKYIARLEKEIERLEAENKELHDILNTSLETTAATMIRIEERLGDFLQKAGGGKKSSGASNSENVVEYESNARKGKSR